MYNERTTARLTRAVATHLDRVDQTGERLRRSEVGRHGVVIGVVTLRAIRHPHITEYAVDSFDAEGDSGSSCQCFNSEQAQTEFFDAFDRLNKHLG